MSFRPLIRGFFFYKDNRIRDVGNLQPFPSPYSGILFLSGCIPKKPKWAKYVSVPSFGDSFFIPRRRSSLQLSAVRVSVPSFGDSFFISCCVFIHSMAFILVSVPSFGDSFFIPIKSKKKYSFPDISFRPLIRGFFFYVKFLF